MRVQPEEVESFISSNAMAVQLLDQLRKQGPPS